MVELFRYSLQWPEVAGAGWSVFGKGAAGRVAAAAFPFVSEFLAGVGDKPDVGLGEGRGCMHDTRLIVIFVAGRFSAQQTLPLTRRSPSPLFSCILLPRF